ncbi:glyoxalase superfamily protein [Chryseobacterium sp. PTM-20240506]|uniref:glyoxalase superfamily protein n=1 Tax=unclassified Chryseobacterium TaxID=2593645 RepID=UPI00235899CB|nr:MULTISPECIES: glyoxalase superfamily protein [unclassified Chryseobacterium]MDC8104391.1 glyoxalase superfamily protein [Chryseobacterium sp. B21-037]MDQ1804005.1 glyoxalase superfamily protein [Chryseobacterium sp. CKR4-1]
MRAEQVIPVLRIFDYNKTIEFYIDWLGFEIVWEHRFEENTPVYLEVKKENMIFHLSEHHGDASPGSSVFIWGEDVADYHKELIDKKYKYNRPGLEKTFYDAVSFTVNDPFGNKIIFNEKFDAKKHKEVEFI